MRWDKVNIQKDSGEMVSGIAPIIISASRSTDLPAFHSKWFINRLKKGYAVWINPFNRVKQYISFQNTRVVVFWTKNAAPIIPYLNELEKRKINYYFQFTINDYEKESYEPNIPKLEERIKIFKNLADKIGKERIIWRFDPVLLTNKVKINHILKKMKFVGDQIHESTKKMVFSFADIAVYKKVHNNLMREKIEYQEIAKRDMLKIAEGIVELNHKWNIEIATCGENIDLSKFKISHNKCIDDDLMIKLFQSDTKLMKFLGYQTNSQQNLFENIEKERVTLKDKGQRKECGCIYSKDIGMYNTCNHLCVYCYANTSKNIVETNLIKQSEANEGIIN